MCRTRLKSYTSVTGVPHISIVYAARTVIYRTACVHTEAENIRFYLSLSSVSVCECIYISTLYIRC